MAKPPMPLNQKQFVKEMNSHEVLFTDKVAPYNKDETAWFPYHRATALCMEGVAMPRRVRDPETGAFKGTWNLSGHQAQLRDQMGLARDRNLGDYAEQAADEALERTEEETRVQQDEVNAAEAKGGGFSKREKGKK